MNHSNKDRVGNTHLTTEALKTLKKYSCIEIKTVDSEEEKQILIEALILIVGLSEAENLGICASNSEEGFKSLISYLKAFGYTNNIDLNTIEKQDNPIFIKFNTRNMSVYIDSYQGDYRGVLVSCESEDDKIMGTYGHFPLDLFL